MTTFAFLAFDDVEELDLVGPWEFLTGGLQREDLLQNAFIVAESAETIKCAKGLRIVPDYTFETCPEFSFLLIPGGWGTRAQAKNKKLLEFLEKRVPRCQAVLSVCTGAFLLAEIGALQGKRATTHWASLDRLRAIDGIIVVEERFTRDGNIWTSAGVSAGMDMALEFIKATFGEDVASKIQFYTEYYPSGTVYGNPSEFDGAPDYVKENEQTRYP